MPGMFDPSAGMDPLTMLLMGGAAGLGQAGATSRLPISTASAFGGLGAGLMAGQRASDQSQLQQQEALRGALGNEMQLAQLGFVTGQQPTRQDIMSGRYRPDFANMFSSAQAPAQAPSAAPTQAAAPSPAPQMPAPPQQRTVGGMAVGGVMQRLTAQTAINSGFDPQFALAHIKSESNFNPMEVGPALDGHGRPQQRPLGIAQFSPDTATQWGVKDPMNAQDALGGYGRMFASLLQQTNGDYEKAAELYGTIPRDPSRDDRNQATLRSAAQDANQRAQNAQQQTAPATSPDRSEVQSGSELTGFATPMDAARYNFSRQLLGLPITNLDKNLISQGMAPPQLQKLYQAQTMEGLGYKPMEFRQGGGVAVPGPDLQYRQAFEAPVLGRGIQTNEGPGGQRTAGVVPGYLPAEQKVEAAAAAGKATMEPQQAVIPEGQPGAGTPFVMPRSQALAPGAPPVITGLSPQAKAGQEKAGQYGAEFGNMIQPGAAPNAPAAAAGAPAQAAQTGTKLGIDPVTGKDLLSVIPPASVQQLPQSPAEAQSMQKPWQDRKDEFADAVDPAQQAEERLLDQASIYKLIETGAWKENKATIAAKLKSMGINPSMVNLDDPAGIETALHENYQGTLNYLKTVNNRFTQREFATLSEYNPNPNLQPTTNLQLLSESIGILRRDQALAKDWETAQKNGWRNPVSWETQYMSANPLGPIVNSVAREIGPLKGMAPNAGAAGAPYSPTGEGPRGTAAIPPAASITKTLGGVTYHKIGDYWYPETK